MIRRFWARSARSRRRPQMGASPPNRPAFAARVKGCLFQLKRLILPRWKSAIASWTPEADSLLSGRSRPSLSSREHPKRVWDRELRTGGPERRLVRARQGRTPVTPLNRQIKVRGRWIGGSNRRTVPDSLFLQKPFDPSCDSEQPRLGAGAANKLK